MLTSVEMDILTELLINGDNTPTNIARARDRSKSAVSARLAELEEKSLVRNKGGGVYQLTYQGAVMSRTVINHRRNGEGSLF